MKIKKAPSVVKLTEMCRDWWVYYRWEMIMELGNEEPQYINCGYRPIEDAGYAARQFDEWINEKQEPEGVTV
jgi:hypothetical protein